MTNPRIDYLASLASTMRDSAEWEDEANETLAQIGHDPIDLDDFPTDYDDALAEYAVLAAMAIDAKPRNDDEWGSDRQIDAENAFFDRAHSMLNAGSGHFVAPTDEPEGRYDYLWKPTIDEAIDDMIGSVRRFITPPTPASPPNAPKKLVSADLVGGMSQIEGAAIVRALALGTDGYTAHTAIVDLTGREHDNDAQFDARINEAGKWAMNNAPAMTLRQARMAYTHLTDASYAGPK